MGSFLPPSLPTPTLSHTPFPLNNSSKFPKWWLLITHPLRPKHNKQNILYWEKRLIINSIKWVEKWGKGKILRRINSYLKLFFNNFPMKTRMAKAVKNKKKTLTANLNICDTNLLRSYFFFLLPLTRNF